VLFTKDWHWWWYGFAYPLCIAVVYVAFAPFAYRWVTLFIKEREKLTIEKLMQVADETPLPNEAANRLRKRIFQLEEEKKSQETVAQKELDELSAQVQLLKQENLDLVEKLKAGGLSSEESTATDDATTGSNSPGEDGTVDLGKVAGVGSNDKNPTLKAKRTFAFDVGQFVGVNPSDVVRLNEAGMTGDEILALYRLRNLTAFETTAFASVAQARDTFSAQVIFDRLIGLSLIRRVPNSARYQLTSFARQVLDTLMQAGVVEKLLAEPV
jgi:hypothetical protein